MLTSPSHQLPGSQQALHRKRIREGFFPKKTANYPLLVDKRFTRGDHHLEGKLARCKLHGDGLLPGVLVVAAAEIEHSCK